MSYNLVVSHRCFYRNVPMADLFVADVTDNGRKSRR